MILEAVSESGSSARLHAFDLRTRALFSFDGVSQAPFEYKTITHSRSSSPPDTYLTHLT
jgi:hypothetical protein